VNSKQPDNLRISNSKSQTPVCLTIAGLDPSGGAGIIADIKTFTAFGCFATAAITSLTFQNTTGVFGAIHQTAESIRGQIEPVIEDYTVAGLKTGMLPTREVIGETARIVKENRLKNFVVDPVVRSTSGFDLIDDQALRVLIEQLFPLADVVTPNLPEAERITRRKIETENDVRQAAKTMQSFGARNVLIKGGHLFDEKKANQNAVRIARDFLFTGDDLQTFEAEYIETNATHGTGCALAAAITANLALGKNLNESVAAAKRFVTQAIRRAPQLGKGHAPINLLPERF
jgi:hydroxymethylpyrimidine kinase/phosphomethylpyrimidine kinase